jgi:predicted adenine nucleotide alpha hydrolase (AANH) superfamily ATPase
VPKEIWIQKKKELIFFSCRTLCQKKWVPKKNVSSKKKEFKLSFFEPNIVPEKSMTAQKKMSSEKKRNSYFFGPNIAPKKGTHTFEGIFLPVLFFLFDLKISSNKDKSTGKICFSTFFFV